MDMTATVTIKGNLFAGKVPRIVEKNLQAAMYEAVAFLERAVKEITPRGVLGAEGGLLSTIQGEVMGKGAPLIKGVVGTGSKYGEVVEKGRTPARAMPPKGVLVKWLAWKMGIDDTTAARIEFVVRRKIARKGFEGAHMFEKAFTENFSHIQGIFERMGFSIAREMDT